MGVQQVHPVRNRVKRTLLGCLFILDFVLFMTLLSCGGLYLIGVYLPQTQAQALSQANKTLWTANGSSNYVLRVARGGGLAGQGEITVYVQNNNVLGQALTKCTGEDEHCFLSTLFHADLTLNDLFVEASECTGLGLSCSVKYEPTLGYPKTIDYPCYDCPFSWTRVLELRLNPQIIEF